MIWPVPLTTADVIDGVESVHGPPTSAEPRPLATLRSKVSEAYWSVTVTLVVVVPVSPPLSVTVSVTG